jgi:hypothetical protein
MPENVTGFQPAENIKNQYISNSYQHLTHAFINLFPRRAKKTDAVDSRIVLLVGASMRKPTRHSPGTLGTCFSGAPDTIRTRDRCLLGLARNPSPAPAIELAVLDANSHADYRQRGSLQLFSSLNTASTRSLPQILLPAFLGCSRKA